MEYNRLAVEVRPPRPVLDPNEVMEYSQIGQFVFLRDSRYNVLNQPWAQPLGRQAMDTWFKMQRAEEELKRVTIEAKRLATYISDEEKALEECILQLLSSGQRTLALQLKYRYELFSGINNDHIGRLEHISNLQGIPLSIGTRKSQEQSGDASAEANWRLQQRSQPLGIPQGTSVADYDSDADDIRNRLDTTLDIMERGE
jgi:hypothetical protein